MLKNDTRLDLKMAITAWKTLWLEASANQDRYDKVWQPTQQLFDNLSTNPPPTLTCFAGKHYMFPGDSDGVAVNLFFIGENHAVYLGTLFDKTANRIDRKREIARLAIINRNLSRKLKSADPQAIVRDAHFCKIPAETDALDTETAAKAVKRYLAIRAPQLSGCKIAWLKEKDGVALEQRIRTKAEQTAKHPTRKERLLATAEDELELWL